MDYDKYSEKKNKCTHLEGLIEFTSNSSAYILESLLTCQTGFTYTEFNEWKDFYLTSLAWLMTIFQFSDFAACFLNVSHYAVMDYDRCSNAFLTKKNAVGFIG